MSSAKIYTKTGDDGKTSLVNGQRVAKTHPRLEAYGTVDELNSFLGRAVFELRANSLAHEELEAIQNQLFNIGSHLACDGDRSKLPSIDESSIEALEGSIDKMNESLEPLREFILPGGSAPSTYLQISRTICRRAERLTLAISDVDPVILKYLNRLSDYLFVLSRFCNKALGATETKWTKK